MAPKPRPARERFEAMIDRSGDCWQWTGSVNPNGYGSFKVPGLTTLAHRFAYLTFVGPIADGLVLDHLCRNRACVNPAHLDAVPQRNNILRGESVAATVIREDVCANGHHLDDRNSYYRPDRPGQRICRDCHRARQAAYVERKRLGDLMAVVLDEGERRSA